MAQLSRRTEPEHLPNGATPLFDCAFGRDHLGAMRGQIGRHAARHGLVDRAQFNFILVVNELTTNAVRHGGGHGCLRLWRHGDSLWCEIADNGPGIASRYLGDLGYRPPDRLAGHGLWLTHRICETVYIDTGRHGTRVLLRYPLPAATP